MIFRCKCNTRNVVYNIREKGKKKGPSCFDLYMYNVMGWNITMRLLEYMYREGGIEKRCIEDDRESERSRGAHAASARAAAGSCASYECTRALPLSGSRAKSRIIVERCNGE